MTDYRVLSIAEVADKLENAKNAMIICHITPDGDTVGSAFALKAIIESAGGYAKVRCPQEAAEKLSVLYLGQDRIKYTQGDEDGCDLVLSIDVAAPSQLGSLDAIKDKIDLMIDHHYAGEAFADNYIDPTASSSGEIVFRIYREMLSRGVITAIPDAARRMYAAMVSDTGSFRYTNTTPETLRAAADLSETVALDKNGLCAADFVSAMYGARTKKEVTAQRLALESLEYYGEDVSLVTVTADEMAKNDLHEDDVGNVVDVGRNIEGIKVALSLKQNPADRRVFRLSSRANCDTDLAKICFDSFGGGGHKRAAGATVYASSVDEAKSAVLAAFRDKYKEYLKK